MIDYMRGSLCVLSEDGTQSPQRPGWSHSDVHAQSLFLKRLNAILKFQQIFLFRRGSLLDFLPSTTNGIYSVLNSALKSQFK